MLSLMNNFEYVTTMKSIQNERKIKKFYILSFVFFLLF